MTTSYSGLDERSKDPVFQGMCYCGCWDIAIDIDNTPPENTTPERKSWAAKIMRRQQLCTNETMCFLVMRDPDVRGPTGGVNATDEQIRNGVLLSLDDFVRIG